LGVGFLYRVYGLDANHSFWTDENHVAIFTRAILERGQPVLANGYSTGVYQFLQYWLSAISARIFGLNEFGIRFPSVIFGVLTIWAVWLLGKEIFTSEVYSPPPRCAAGGTSNVPATFDCGATPPRGCKSLSTSEVFVPLIAALFITFLKIEILWSRQARPYQALQFFFLLGAWFLYRGNLFGFLVCGVLASLMHGLGLVIFPIGLIYLLLSGKLGRFGFLGVLGALGVLGVVFWEPIGSVIANLGKINNLFYYRVFLWHNYPLLGILGGLGVLGALVCKKRDWLLPVLFLTVQGMIASFLLGQPFTRYFYIVFPFLVLLAVGGLGKLGNLGCFGRKNKLVKSLTVLILAFFIVAMGDKFTILPKKAYSLNEDIQEIPEVDWKEIYGFVGEKLRENPETILVTNWNDLPVWYLGEGKLDYLLRKPWGEVPPSIDSISGAKIIYSLEDFQKVVIGNTGLLVIDSWDDYVPSGIREYVKSNLKKEFEIDRLYPIQPRYWPVEVYSWEREKELRM
jgi:hypothetical protein